MRVRWLQTLVLVALAAALGAAFAFACFMSWRIMLALCAGLLAVALARRARRFR